MEIRLPLVLTITIRTENYEIMKIISDLFCGEQEQEEEQEQEDQRTGGSIPLRLALRLPLELPGEATLGNIILEVQVLVMVLPTVLLVDMIMIMCN